MAEESLPLDRIQAGAEYLQALRKLGLEPEGLLWVRYDDRPDWILLLITRMYDIGGPLALTKLLFKAYNASVLPQNIDPFNVDIYSPDQQLVQLILDYTKSISLSSYGYFGDNKLAKTGLIFFALEKIITIPANGIYIWEIKRKLNSKERAENWRNFQKNVEVLAA